MGINMTKIEAIDAILKGECDEISFGASIYILHNGGVVNKRSKKPMDTAHMTEEGWEKIIVPKWYDEITTPILCWVSPGDMVLIEEHKDGKFNGVSKGDDYATWEKAKPVTEEEVLLYIYGFKKKRKTVKQKEETQKVEKQEECQTTKLESIATPKEETVEVSGIPILVEENKDFFFDNGLPEHLLKSFAITLKLNSTNVEEFIDKGAEECKDKVSTFLEASEEIPF